MSEDINDIFTDDTTADGNVLQAYQDVQRLLDQFVAVSYDTAYKALRSHSGDNNADYLREQIVPILRDNPPFATIPKYLRDGRENYLWYSDFYDDAGMDVFRQYGQFSAPAVKITAANYAGELNKIGLPYFAELVNLVSLEKLYLETEKRIAVRAKEDVHVDEVEPANESEEPQPSAEKPPKPKRLTGKRSYEPKLNSEQFSLLAECIESIKLFRRPTPVSELKKLLTGKLKEPLQVANQNSLTYLFDKLGESGLIREKWIAVAVSNKDFLSFRRGKNKIRYGNESHYIPMQQFSNCRINNKITGFKDLIPIDEAIEKIQQCGNN